MRTIVGVALVLTLATTGPARAGEREDALAVIEQAVKAHGGEDALTRAQTAVRTSTGAIASPTGKDLPFKDEMSWKLPDRFRLSLEVGAEKTRLVTVVTSDKGWQMTGGQVAELSAERLGELREESFFDLRAFRDAHDGEVGDGLERIGGCDGQLDGHRAPGPDGLGRTRRI